MNVSQTIHEKIHRFAVYATEDIGSGVKSLHVFGQATDIGDGSDADINLAELLPDKLIDVDNTPSYSNLGTSAAPYYKDQLVLRNISSLPIKTDADKVPKHNKDNIYVYEFDNYINGKAYYLWSFGSDKVNNGELLNVGTGGSGTGEDINTSTVPLKITGKLIDDIAPEFDNIETLTNLSWDSNNSRYQVSNTFGVTDDNSANTKFKNKVLIFADQSGNRERYIEQAFYVIATDKVQFQMDVTGLANVTSTSGKLLPTVAVKGGVGSLELDYPLSNSVNLKGFKIERRVTNTKLNPDTTTDVKGDSQLSAITWQDAQYINAEKFVDRGLILSKANLEYVSNDSNEFNDKLGLKFLYRVTPISLFKDAVGNEIKGQPLYTTKHSFNTVNYRPSAGATPNNVVSALMSSSNGNVTLDWSNAQDDNGDLKGYEIHRARVVNGVAEPYVIIASAKVGEYNVGITYDKKYIDEDLEPYNPNLIEYSYKILSFDWAGNVSSFTQFKDASTNTIIKATDIIAPDSTKLELKVYGKIGAWGLEFVDNDFINNKTVEVEIFRKRVNSDGTDMPTETEISIGKATVGTDGVAYYTDQTPPSGAVWYGKFRCKARDKFNNWSAFTTITTHIATDTPSSAQDRWAPKAPTGITAVFDEVNGWVLVGWTNPTEEEIYPSLTVLSKTTNTVTFTAISDLSDDELTGKELRVLTGTGSGTTGTIISNTSSSITVDAWSGVAPIATSTIEVYGTPLTDHDGCKILKKLSGGTDWEFVTDTNSAVITSFKDKAFDNGDWIYGIQSYDFSGNDSPITEIVSAITIADSTPPSKPIVKGIMGGAGSLLLWWNRPSKDTASYKIFIKNAIGTVIVNGVAVIPEQYNLYNVVDTKDNIDSYSYLLKAIDYNGNESTDTVYSTGLSAITYLNDYVPASGVLPSNPTVVGSTQQDGDAKLVISNIDVDSRTLVISRKTRNLNSTAWVAETYSTIAEIPAPLINSAGAFLNDAIYNDYLNDRLIAKYKVQAVGSGGLISLGVESLDITVVDKIGYDLGSAILGATVISDIGSVKFSFKDVIDKRQAKYELWRTSTTDVVWDDNLFYTDATIQPKPVDTRWEKIATLSSTEANNTQTDFLQCSDLDWQVNGTIDSEDTILALPYTGKAVYVLVGVDRWGNRGTIFVLPNSTKDAESVIYLPYEPRVNRIEKDAVYWDFNRGIQSNIGHVVLEDTVDAKLYKGKGIEVLGAMTYDLKAPFDTLANDFSLVLRRLEKSLDAMGLNLTSITDVFIYDTSKEDDSWIGLAGFPSTALVISALNHLYIYDYQSSELVFDFIVGATNMLPFEVNSIHAIDGKIIVTGNGVVILDFKNDSGRWIQSATDKVYGGAISDRNGGLSYA